MNLKEKKEIIEMVKAYREKYGIRFSSNFGVSTIIRKKVGRNTFYMNTGLDSDTIDAMMKTSIKIGTNYLEDSLIAAGKKWVSTHPDNLRRGTIA
jgi:hypothetical protein